MRLGLCPPDERVPRFLRQLFGELAASLLGADEHDLRRLQTAATAIELLGDALEMFLHELLEVSLIPRLRPATLVVRPWLLLELVGDRLESARP